jgi:phosphatidylinositol 3,5-bisphosphate 5-phosphatase
MILNLLSKKGDEEVISNAFKSLCKSSPYYLNKTMSFERFDYYKELKSNDNCLTDKLLPIIKRFTLHDDEFNSYFYRNSTESNTTLQRRIIRTNCNNCLERTNDVQAFIGLEMLENQLKNFNTNKNELKSLKEVRITFEIIHRIYHFLVIFFI